MTNRDYANVISRLLDAVRHTPRPPVIDTTRLILDLWAVDFNVFTPAIYPRTSGLPAGLWFDRAATVRNVRGLPNLILAPPPYHPLEVLVSCRGDWGFGTPRATIDPGFLALNKVRGGGWEAVADAWGRGGRAAYLLLTPFEVNADPRLKQVDAARIVVYEAMGFTAADAEAARKSTSAYYGYEQNFWEGIK